MKKKSRIYAKQQSLDIYLKTIHPDINTSYRKYFKKVSKSEKICEICEKGMKNLSSTRHYKKWGKYTLIDYSNPSQVPKSEKAKSILPKLEEIKKSPSWPLKVAYCLQ